MNINRFHNHPIIIILLIFILECMILETEIYALPKIFKINSVKSLTYILSKVEKENGNQARYVTLKLQIYLEDIYISQGTSVILKPKMLSRAIKTLVIQEKSRNTKASYWNRRCSKCINNHVFLNIYKHKLPS